MNLSYLSLPTGDIQKEILFLNESFIFSGLDIFFCWLFFFCFCFCWLLFLFSSFFIWVNRALKSMFMMGTCREGGQDCDCFNSSTFQRLAVHVRGVFLW